MRATSATYGVLKELMKRLVERALKGEITSHLGYEKHATAGRNSGNSRNGATPKGVLTSAGEHEIEVPRDRNGEFEPQLVSTRRPAMPTPAAIPRLSPNCTRTVAVERLLPSTPVV